MVGTTGPTASQRCLQALVFRAVRSTGHAAYPIADPVAPVDIAATIYERLGISPDLRIPDAQGRPVPIADGGRVLKEIL